MWSSFWDVLSLRSVTYIIECIIVCFLIEPVCSHVVGGVRKISRHLFLFLLLCHILQFACSFISAPTHTHTHTHTQSLSVYLSFFPCCCLEIKISWFSKLHCVRMVKWFWFPYRGKLISVFSYSAVIACQISSGGLFCLRCLFIWLHGTLTCLCLLVCVCVYVYVCVWISGGVDRDVLWIRLASLPLSCWLLASQGCGVLQFLSRHTHTHTHAHTRLTSHLSRCYVWDTIPRCHCFCHLMMAGIKIGVFSYCPLPQWHHQMQSSLKIICLPQQNLQKQYYSNLAANMP